MQNVDFVGSSGIGQFVETLKIVNKNRTKVKLSNVRSEFLKSFQLYKLSEQDLKNMVNDFESDPVEGPAIRYGRPLSL